ncbi:MAG: GAF domain-containing protein, partial [Chloroflexota bacterium]
FLSVDKKQAGYFGQSDIEFATIFAHHAAMAITRTDYNQRLEEWLLETELYAEQLEAVNQFSTEVNVDLQLQRILSVTVQRVAEWFDVPRSAIALIEDGADYAQVIAHWPDRQGRGARIPLDNAVARHILHHKEPLAIDNAQEDPLLQDDGIRQIVRKNDIRSMLIVPILIRDEVAGTIGLDVVGQKRIFTRDEIEWAKRIALQAGLAINNARQRDQWHRRAMRRSNYLRRALEASKKVAAVRRGDDALKAIARNLHRMFDYDSVILFPYLAADEIFERPVIAGSVRHEEAVQSRVVSQSRVAQLIQHEEPYYFTDDSINDKHFKGPFVEREGIASSGFVRLTVADETLGLLFVNSCTPRTFSEEEIDAVSLFANLAALAIRNVRHYAQLQSEVGELEVLLATQHANGEPRSRMMQFEETAAALLKQGYDSVAIYPYDPFVRQFDTPILLGDVTDYEDTIGAVRLEGTVVGRRMTEGEEYYFTDSPQDADDLHAGEFVKREGIRASASLRLRTNDRVFGLLFVNKKEPFHFSRQRRHLLALTASNLAMVQREACERRYSAKQREHLEQIRRKVGNTLDLDEVRDEIYKGLWKMFGEDALPALLMYDDADKNLRLLYTDALASRVDVPSQQGREHLGMGEGLCGWVAREREAANAPDVRQDERYLCMHSATRSELAVPIIGRDDQLVGVLDVESPRLQHFGEEDERWLQSVASEVATAVWNAGQYRRRGQLLEAFQNSIRPIMSSPKRGPTLQAILAEAAELTGSHLATIQQLRGDRLCLEAVHPPEILDELRASIGDCLSMEDDTVTVKAARLRETQCVKDTSECENFLSSGLEERESGSEVAAPILNEDGTVWGVLNVEWRSTNAFDEEEVLALTSLANLASVALHTIRRTDELRRTSSVAALGAWNATLIHENNSNVASIRRSVFLLEDNTNLPAEARQRLRQIDAYAEKMDLQGLLPSPPKPGDTLPSEATAVVDSILHAEAQRFRQTHNGIFLETNLTCPGLCANIHRRWLRQILQLLVNNALEAPGEAARHIIISSERQGGYVRISVQDNAVGVPKEYRDDLFERQIVKENGRASQGAVLVRTLVDLHGGHLEPIETETGVGTTITFQLPLADEGQPKERRIKEMNA